MSKIRVVKSGKVARFSLDITNNDEGFVKPFKKPKDDKIQVKQWFMSGINDPSKKGKKKVLQAKNKKRMAILFFGISYLESYDHWAGKNYCIDYKKSFKNYKNYIFNFFEQNYNIDVFLSTYDSKKRRNIINDYKPKKFAFIEKMEHNHQKSRNMHFTNALKLCLDYSKKEKVKYDNVIITRFDLHFKMPFTTCKINYDKLNLVSTLERKHLICDNFYIMHFSYLPSFYKLCSKYTGSYHRLKGVLEKKYGDINFLKDEQTWVSSLSFYKIVRTNA